MFPATPPVSAKRNHHVPIAPVRGLGDGVEDSPVRVPQRSGTLRGNGGCKRLHPAGARTGSARVARRATAATLASGARRASGLPRDAASRRARLRGGRNDERVGSQSSWRLPFRPDGTLHDGAGPFGRREPRPHPVQFPPHAPAGAGAPAGAREPKRLLQSPRAGVPPSSGRPRLVVVFPPRPRVLAGKPQEVLGGKRAVRPAPAPPRRAGGHPRGKVSGLGPPRATWCTSLAPSLLAGESHDT